MSYSFLVDEWWDIQSPRRHLRNMNSQLSETTFVSYCSSKVISWFREKWFPNQKEGLFQYKQMSKQRLLYGHCVPSCSRFWGTGKEAPLSTLPFLGKLPRLVSMVYKSPANKSPIQQSTNPPNYSPTCHPRWLIRNFI